MTQIKTTMQVMPSLCEEVVVLVVARDIVAVMAGMQDHPNVTAVEPLGT